MSEFEREWTAEVLGGAPLIAPARRYVYPQRVPGEEDALGRGALEVMVQAAVGGTFLATCVRGFADASMPTGVYGCPAAWEMCAVAGGYAYVIDTRAPERFTQVAMRPVVEVRSLVERALLLFVGFQSIVAWGREGLAWESARLSWEGVKIASVEGDLLRGTGWDLMADREVEFELDLATGVHRGGGFRGVQKS